MNGKLFLIAGSLLGFLGVAAGAFGAHALKTKLSQEMFQIFEVGIRYHMYHALALLAVAWVSTQYSQNLIQAAGWFFILGVVIFSGSLYILSLSGIKMWGAVTPIGGLLLLAGWSSLALGVWKGQG